MKHKKENRRVGEFLEAKNFEDYARALHNYNTRSAQTARAEETVQLVIGIVRNKLKAGGSSVEITGIFAITDVEARLHDSLIRACKNNVDYHLEIESNWEKTDTDTYLVSW